MRRRLVLTITGCTPGHKDHDGVVDADGGYLLTLQHGEGGDMVDLAAPILAAPIAYDEVADIVRDVSAALEGNPDGDVPLVVREIGATFVRLLAEAFREEQANIVAMNRAAEAMGLRPMTPPMPPAEGIEVPDAR